MTGNVFKVSDYIMQDVLGDGFTRCPNYWFSSKCPLSSEARLILIRLSNNIEEFNLTHEFISRQLNMSVKRVAKYIDELIEYQFVIKMKNPNITKYSSKYVYVVLPKPLPDLVEMGYKEEEILSCASNLVDKMYTTKGSPQNVVYVLSRHNNINVNNTNNKNNTILNTTAESASTSASDGSSETNKQVDIETDDMTNQTSPKRSNNLGVKKRTEPNMREAATLQNLTPSDPNNNKKTRLDKKKERQAKSEEYHNSVVPMTALADQTEEEQAENRFNKQENMRKAVAEEANSKISHDNGLKGREKTKYNKAVAYLKTKGLPDMIHYLFSEMIKIRIHEKKKDASEVQIDLLLDRLNQLGATYEEKVALLQQSVRSNWGDVFDLSEAEKKMVKSQINKISMPTQSKQVVTNPIQGNYSIEEGIPDDIDNLVF